MSARARSDKNRKEQRRGKRRDKIEYNTKRILYKKTIQKQYDIQEDNTKRIPYTRRQYKKKTIYKERKRKSTKNKNTLYVNNGRIQKEYNIKNRIQQYNKGKQP
jgi:hypothetical protein